MASPKLRRSDHLLGVLDGYREVLVVMHDNPDPDAIAAGWAIHTLVHERLKKPVHLIGGGAILRAENAHMVKVLKPPIELLDRYAPSPDCAPVLVDCAPEGANHLLGGGAAKPVAVIDHHQAVRSPLRVRHRDNRPRAAAAATIASSYLREQHVRPTRELATALLYAVRTESLGRFEPFTRSDRGIIAWLAERADHRVLMEIQNAPLPAVYFGELLRAIETTLVYDDVAMCLLDQAGSAEIVGEVADLLVRCTNVQRVLCGAVVAGDLFLSARTSQTGGEATALLGETLSGLGHWGGHPTRAGGKVPAGDGQSRIGAEVVDEVRRRWLKACAVENRGAQPLVADSHSPGPA